MSEIDAIQEGLDSHAMHNLETPAINFTSLSFSEVNLASATQKVMLRDQSNNMQCKQNVTFSYELCVRRRVRNSAVWYV